MTKLFLTDIVFPVKARNCSPIKFYLGAHFLQRYTQNAFRYGRALTVRTDSYASDKSLLSNKFSMIIGTLCNDKDNDNDNTTNLHI